jgi:Flp pilus assembly protein TadG
MKSFATRLRGLGQKISNLDFFRRDGRGIAAIEFALILPVGLALFTGAVIYGDAIAIDRKVTLTTRTVTDLITQYPSPIALADVQTAMGASAQIMAPYSATPIGVTISQVQISAAGVATISWSVPLNGNSTVRNQGDVVTTLLPASINTPGAFYIWGEVLYTDTPTVGYMVTGSFLLHDQTFMAPRIATAGFPTPQ